MLTRIRHHSTAVIGMIPEWKSSLPSKENPTMTESQQTNLPEILRRFAVRLLHIDFSMLIFYPSNHRADDKSATLLVITKDTPEQDSQTALVAVYPDGTTIFLINQVPTAGEQAVEDWAAQQRRHRPALHMEMAFVYGAANGWGLQIQRNDFTGKNATYLYGVGPDHPVPDEKTKGFHMACNEVPVFTDTGPFNIYTDKVFTEITINERKQRIRTRRGLKKAIDKVIALADNPPSKND